jgi:hypothetical protein
VLVAGKGLGEDVTSGAAARPVAAAREGGPREEGAGEKGKGEEKKKSEALNPGEGCQVSMGRARASLPTQASRAELDLSLRSR